MLTKKELLIVACVVFGFMVLPAHALTLPNYAAGGDLSSSLQSTGKRITDVVSMVVGIVSIIGMLVGAIKIGTGKGEEGKTWVVSGIVALVIAGSVYGIASLAL